MKRKVTFRYLPFHFRCDGVCGGLLSLLRAAGLPPHASEHSKPQESSPLPLRPSTNPPLAYATLLPSSTSSSPPPPALTSLPSSHTSPPLPPPPTLPPPILFLSHHLLIPHAPPRSQLVFSSRADFPLEIHAPTSPLFPLVALASLPSSTSSAPSPPSLPSLARSSRSLLSSHLTSHGAVLLRGMSLGGQEGFSRWGEELGWEVIKLGGGGTQRTDVAKGVRTASDEPASHTIEPHSDMAHTSHHPNRIAFFCKHPPPPGVGGETVLTDLREVLASLERRGIPQQFERRGGVAYRKT